MSHAVGGTSEVQFELWYLIQNQTIPSDPTTGSLPELLLILLFNGVKVNLTKTLQRCLQEEKLTNSVKYSLCFLSSTSHKLQIPGIQCDKDRGSGEDFVFIMADTESVFSCSVSKLLLLILHHLDFWTSSLKPAVSDNNVNNNVSLVYPGRFKVLIKPRQHVRCSISEWTLVCLLLAADFLLTAFVFWQEVYHICIHAVIAHVTAGLSQSPE